MADNRNNGMPSGAYLILNGGRANLVSAEDFDQHKDEFYSNNPGGQVFSLAGYNPDADPAKIGGYMVDGNYIDRDEFVKHRDEYFKNHPDGQVQQMQEYDYWADKLTRQQADIDAWHQNNDEFVQQYEQMMDHYSDDGPNMMDHVKFLTENADRYNQAKEDLDALRSAYDSNPKVMAERDRDRQTQVAMITSGIDDNMQKINEYESQAAAASGAKSGWQKWGEREMSRGVGGLRSVNSELDTRDVVANNLDPQKQKEYNDYKSANDLLERSLDMYDDNHLRKDQMGEESGRRWADRFWDGLKEMGRSAVSEASMESFWNDVRREKNADALVALHEKVQDLIGSYNKIITDKYSADGERAAAEEFRKILDDKLTDSEKKLLAAYLTSLNAQANNDDIHWSSDAGKSAAQSAKLGMEMMVFAPAAGAISGALVAGMSSWAAGLGLGAFGSFAMNLGINIAAANAAGLAVGGIQTLTSVRTYADMAEAMAQINPETGRLDDLGKQGTKALFDEWVENGTELGLGIVGPTGKVIGDTLGDAAKGAAVSAADSWLKRAAVTTFRAGVTISRPLRQLGKTFGFGNFIEEWGEELDGALIRKISGLAPEEWENFWSKEQQLSLVSSLMVPMVPGVIVSDAQRLGYGYMANRKKQALTDALTATGHYSPEQIETILSSFTGESPEELDRNTRVWLGEIARQNVGNVDLQDALVGYRRAIANYLAVDGTWKNQQDQRIQQHRDEITQQVGRFWYNPSSDSESENVRVLIDANGKKRYILTEQVAGTPAQQLAYVDEDGNTGFITPAQIKDMLQRGELLRDRVFGMSDYLIADYTSRDDAADQMRVNGEKARQMARFHAQGLGVQSQVTLQREGVSETGTIVQIMPERDSYVVQFSDGTTNEYTAQELAAAQGITSEVISRREKDAIQASLIDQDAVSKEMANRALRNGARVTLNVNGRPAVVRRVVGVNQTDDGRTVYSVFMDDRTVQVIGKEEFDRMLNTPVEDPQTAAPEGSVPRDFRGNPLPMIDGENGPEVNQAKLWNDDPEAWCRWNDERKGSSDDSIRALNRGIRQDQAMLSAIQQELETCDFNKRDGLLERESEVLDRLNGYQRILDGYLAQAQSAVADQARQELEAMAQDQLAQAVQQQAAQDQAALDKKLSIEAFVKQYDDIPARVVTASDAVANVQDMIDRYLEAKLQKGYSQDEIDLEREDKMAQLRRLQAMLDSGIVPNAFYFLGEIVIFAETEHSLAKVKVDYFHERRHYQNALEPQIIRDVIDAVPGSDIKEKARVMYTAICNIIGGVADEYEGYYNDVIKNGSTRSLEALADELIAFSYQNAATRSDYEARLLARDVPQSVIDIIKNEYEREKNSLLERGNRYGRDAHEYRPGAGGDQQNGGDQAQAATGVAGQGPQSDDGGQGPAPAGAEEEIEDLPEGTDEDLPEEEYVPVSGPNRDFEPLNLTMAVAQAFSPALRGKLNRDDWQRELGFGDAEMKAFWPLWAKKGTGMTLVSMAETIAETSQSGLIPYNVETGSNDTDSVRDAIIDLFSQVATLSDLYGYNARMTNEFNTGRMKFSFRSYSKSVPVDIAASIDATMERYLSPETTQRGRDYREAYIDRILAGYMTPERESKLREKESLEAEAKSLDSLNNPKTCPDQSERPQRKKRIGEIRHILQTIEAETKIPTRKEVLKKEMSAIDMQMLNDNIFDKDNWSPIMIIPDEILAVSEIAEALRWIGWNGQSGLVNSSEYRFVSHRVDHHDEMTDDQYRYDMQQNLQDPSFVVKSENHGHRSVSFVRKDGSLFYSTTVSANQYMGQNGDLEYTTAFYKKDEPHPSGTKVWKKKQEEVQPNLSIRPTLGRSVSAANIDNNSESAKNNTGASFSISPETQKDLDEKGLVFDGGLVMSKEAQDLKNETGYQTPNELPADLKGIAFSLSTVDRWAENYRNIPGARESVIRAVTSWADRAAASELVSGVLSQGEHPYYAPASGVRAKGKQVGPIRTNVEYVVTFDMDTTCPRTFQYLSLSKTIERRIGRPLTQVECIQLIEIMRAYGNQIPCVYCYAENKRQAMKQYYTDFMTSRHAVISADTDQEALKHMYGRDEKKAKKSSDPAVVLTSAAQEVFKAWRQNRDKAYNPSMKTLWYHYSDTRNSILTDLDMMLADGRISIQDKEADIVAAVAADLRISETNALKVVEEIVSEWKWDTIEGKEHQDFTETDEDDIYANENALTLWREMTAYAKSASGAKSVLKYVPYTDELRYISQEDKDYINGMGGLRMHSTNDFRIDYVLDYFQFMADMAANDMLGHTYTKSPEFVRIFGNSGYKINMSIAAYQDKDGRIRMNEDEGFNWEIAKALREAFPNAGVMLMATSDEQIQKALDEDWIDMFIPFHRSGLPVAIWKDMRAWTDYTTVQNERFYNSTDMKRILKENGIPFSKSMKAKEIAELFNEKMGIIRLYDEKGKRIKPHFLPGPTKVGGQDIPGHGNSAEEYFRLCRLYGVHPRFKGVRVHDAEGNEIDITEHPGYIKCIKETARTDNGQAAIEFNFDQPYTEEQKNLINVTAATPLEYAFSELEARAMAKAKEAGRPVDDIYNSAKKDVSGIVDDFISHVIRHKEQTGKDYPIDYLTPDSRRWFMVERKALQEAYKDVMEIPYHPNVYDEAGNVVKDRMSFSITPAVREEMDVIEAEARLDGTYMKAPNGMDTKLSAEQWAMVRTKNFKNWFGDWINDPENASKVVDPETGEPMVVYHGTGWNAMAEQPGEAVFYDQAYFSDDKDIARSFGSRVFSVFLNFRNPYVFNGYTSGWASIDPSLVSDLDVEIIDDFFDDFADEDENENGVGYTSVNEVYHAALRKGYDSVIAYALEDAGGTGDQYVASDPGQIKSATENNGNFDPTDPDIRYSFTPTGRSMVERTYRTNGSFTFTGKNRIESIDDVAFIFRELQEKATENSFLVLIKKGVPTILHTGIGDATNTYVDYTAAVAGYNDFNPDEVYMVHNHPSGNLVASRADKKCLQDLSGIFEGIPVKGLILDTVTGDYGFFTGSTDGVGQMPEDGDEYPVEVLSFDKQVFDKSFKSELNSRKVTQSSDVAGFLSAYRLGEGNKLGALLLNRNNLIVANIVTNENELNDGSSRAVAGQIADAAAHSGSVATILFGNFDFDTNAMLVLKSDLRKLSGNSVQILDVVQVDSKGEYRSVADETLSGRKGGIMFSANPVQDAGSKEDTNKNWSVEELSLSLQKVQDAVNSGNWSEEDLDNINYLVDSLENGELTYNRGIQECQEAYRESGRVLQAITCILGAGEGTGRSSEGSQLSAAKPGSLSLFDRQKQSVEAWAKAAGVWVEGDINSYLRNQYGEPFQSASESEVYLDGADVVKSFEPGAVFFDDLRQTVDRIVIGNTLFPEVRNTIEKIGNSYYGQLIFVLRQPYVQGDVATPEDIADYFERIGMTRESSTTFHDDNLVVSDMKVDNVVKIGDDIIAFDGIFEYDEQSDNVGKSYDITPTGIGDIRFSVAYHGTGAVFDSFDHSHMGEGEGAQAHGWGTYVTFDEDLAGAYATKGVVPKLLKGGALKHNSQPVQWRFLNELNDWNNDLKDLDLDSIIAEGFRWAVGRNPKDSRPLVDKAMAALWDKYDYMEVRDHEGASRILEARDYLMMHKDEYQLDIDGKRNVYTVDIPEDNGSNYLDEDRIYDEDEVAEITRRLWDANKDDDSFDYDYFDEKLQDYADYSNVDGRAIYQALQKFGFNGDKESASLALANAGYVGIKYVGRVDGPCAVIFQADDARITDRMAFSMKGNARQEVFVSNALQAVEALNMTKAPAANWIKAIQGKGGLKAGEDKWLGLSEWLNSQDGQVTRDDVMNYIRQNQIRIEEVKYGEVSDISFMEEKYPGFTEAFEIEYDMDGEPHVYIRHLSKAEAFYDRFKDEDMPNDDPSEDALENFAEYLLEDYVNDHPDEIGGKVGKPINGTRAIYTTNGLENKREIALTVPTIEPYNETDNIHFGDAGNGRAVAWIRFGDTVLRDGEVIYDALKSHLYSKYGTHDEKRLEYRMSEEDRQELAEADRKKTSRVLVIDEIQSKRHQDGREKGYYSVESILSSAGLTKRTEGTKEFLYNAEGNPIARREDEIGKECPTGGVFVKPTEQEIKARDEYFRMQLRGGLNGNSLTNVSGKVPDAPFDKNWHELAMKRMLRLAAEEGYDKIAWTNGDMQAERYDIGNVFDAIRRVGNDFYMFGGPEGQVTISVDENNRITNSTLMGVSKGALLSGVVGKELAERMVSMQEDEVLELGGQRIGGDGMKGFYDDILPRFMNKYGKKWGVSVQDIDLPGLGNVSGWHSVDVTPEMKESVMRGQPMFSFVGQRAAKALDELNENSERLDALKTAQDMEAAGDKTPQQIKMATGWEHGEDGQWRLEMPDILIGYDIELRPDTYMMDEFVEDTDEYSMMKTAYALDGWKVELVKEYKLRWRGVTDSKRKVISLNLIEDRKPRKFEDIQSTFIHEIQHVIQEMEGFARGGSPVMFKNIPEVVKHNDRLKEIQAESNRILDEKIAQITPAAWKGKEDTMSKYRKQSIRETAKMLVTADPRIKQLAAEYDTEEYAIKEILYKEYERLGGEVEARNVQLRARMSDEERRSTVASDTAEYKGKDLRIWRNSKSELDKYYVQAQQAADDIASNGLEKELGRDSLDDFAMDFYEGAPEAVKDKVEAMAAGMGYNFTAAVQDILGEAATDFTEEGSAVISQAREQLARMGYDMPMREARWALWSSAHPAQSGDILAEAERISTAMDLGMDPESVQGRREAMGQMRFSLSAARMAKDMTEAYNYDASRSWHRLRESVVDQFDAVQRLVDAVVKFSKKPVKGFEDVMKSLNQQSSRALAAYNKWNGSCFKPLLETVSSIISDPANDYTYDDVVKYMLLKHGVERTQVIGQGQQDAGALTALTNGTDLQDCINIANTQIAAFEAKVDPAQLSNLWTFTKAATDAKLDQQLQSGLISRQQYDRAKTMFQYYVPMKGSVDPTAEDMFTYIDDRVVMLTGKLPKTEGRETLPQNPLGHIARDMHMAIAQGLKNESKQALYFFLSNRGPSGLYTISDTWYELTLDAQGNVIDRRPSFPVFTAKMDDQARRDAYDQWLADMKAKEALGTAIQGDGKLSIPGVAHIDDRSIPQHCIVAKINGVNKTIVINGNPRAAQAVNGLLNMDKVDVAVFKQIAALNRWIASLATQLNPDFWTTNAQRDLLFAFASQHIKGEGMRNMARAMQSPRTIYRLSKAYEEGTLAKLTDIPQEIRDYYEEFATEGAITGYTAVNEYTELEKAARLAATEKEKAMLAGWRGFAEAFSRVGESVEQMTRFAAYVTARRNGSDVINAVNAAKEISVNFNRKGSGQIITWEESAKLTMKDGTFLAPSDKDSKAKALEKLVHRAAIVTLSDLNWFGRQYIMFYNAAVQGLNAAYKLWEADKKKTAGWVGGVFALGALNAMIQPMLESLAGGDDDDDKEQYLDNPDYDRRSSVLIGANGVYFKWALPQEAKAFYSMGDALVNKLRGEAPDKVLGKEYAEILMEALPYNPLNLTDYIPSGVAPLTDNARNKDFKGAKIYNDMPYLDEADRKMLPNYQKAYRNTGRVYVEISKILNNLTGGDEAVRGAINLNPGKMEHFVEGYTGGTGVFLSNLIKSTVGQLWGESFEVRNMPFLRRLFAINNERTRSSHTTDVFNYYKDIAEQTDTRIKKYRKSEEEGAQQRLDRLMESDEYRILEIYQGYAELEKQYRKYLKDETDQQARKALMKEQDAYRRQMVREITEALKSR